MIVMLIPSIISLPLDVLRRCRPFIASSSPHGQFSTLNDAERGRKSKKHKGTSDGSDDEADDERASYYV